MKVTFLIGSPKMGQSFSEKILEMLQRNLKQRNCIVDDSKIYNINRKPLSKEERDEICNSDVLVVAFPLYVDGIPGHLLEQLTVLEKEFRSRDCHDLMLYGIINNGFIEGIQSRNAARMLELFARRAGIRMGQILCVGAGEMTRMMLNMKIPFGKGPLSKMDHIYTTFLSNLSARKEGEMLVMQPSYAGWIFRAMSASYFWRPAARKNGLSGKDLNRRIIPN